jgi:hypothetical protein
MIGKPYSGKLNVRFDEGELEIEPRLLRQFPTLPLHEPQRHVTALPQIVENTPSPPLPRKFPEFPLKGPKQTIDLGLILGQTPKIPLTHNCPFCIFNSPQSEFLSIEGFNWAALRFDWLWWQAVSALAATG